MPRRRRPTNRRHSKEPGRRRPTNRRRSKESGRDSMRAPTTRNPHSGIVNHITQQPLMVEGNYGRSRQG